MLVMRPLRHDEQRVGERRTNGLVVDELLDLLLAGVGHGGRCGEECSEEVHGCGRAMVDATGGCVAGAFILDEDGVLRFHATGS